MRIFRLISRVVLGAIALALTGVATGLIVYAGMQLVSSFRGPEQDIGGILLVCIGYIVIAVAVFEVAKYIFEEEVFDPAEMRRTGEARRSITKFVSTIAIAVFLEALLAIFQTTRGSDLSQMLYPTLLLLAGVALIVGLGVYQRLSVASEQVIANEPVVLAEEEEGVSPER